jgi:hypothetical protein
MNSIIVDNLPVGVDNLIYVIYVPISLYGMYVNWGKAGMPKCYTISIKLIFLFILLGSLFGLGEDYITQPALHDSMRKCHFSAGGAVEGQLLFMFITWYKRRKEKNDPTSQS